MFTTRPTNAHFKIEAMLNGGVVATIDRLTTIDNKLAIQFSFEGRCCHLIMIVPFGSLDVRSSESGSSLDHAKAYLTYLLGNDEGAWEGAVVGLQCAYEWKLWNILDPSSVITFLAIFREGPIP